MERADLTTLDDRDPFPFAVKLARSLAGPFQHRSNMATQLQYQRPFTEGAPSWRIIGCLVENFWA